MKLINSPSTQLLTPPCFHRPCSDPPIRLLLSPGVPPVPTDEARYHPLSISTSTQPISTPQVCRQYPQMKLITSEIDRNVNDDFVVVPGIGEFGDRFFSE